MQARPHLSEFLGAWREASGSRDSFDVVAGFWSLGAIKLNKVIFLDPREDQLMADPFTIRIFVPDGDPDSVQIVDRMNWTGLGIAFPREKWPSIKHRLEFSKTGVYILVGYQDDELPTIYVGQGDGIGNRIESTRTRIFGTGE